MSYSWAQLSCPVLKTKYLAGQLGCLAKLDRHSCRQTFKGGSGDWKPLKLKNISMIWFAYRTGSTHQAIWQEKTQRQCSWFWPSPPYASAFRRRFDLNRYLQRSGKICLVSLHRNTFVPGLAFALTIKSVVVRFCHLKLNRDQIAWHKDFAWQPNLCSEVSLISVDFIVACGLNLVRQKLSRQLLINWHALFIIW